MTNSSFGFFQSDAVFARNLLEAVRCSSLRTCWRIILVSHIGFGGPDRGHRLLESVPLKGMYAIPEEGRIAHPIPKAWEA